MFLFYVFSALNSLQKFAMSWSDYALTMFAGKCLEMWSKHLEYHLNVQSALCVCMRAHVCMCIRESVLVYVRRLIQKFVDILNKHSNWIDLWMILYIHITTSLMNIQIKKYESILNGIRVTAHFNQWSLAVWRTPQGHFYVRYIWGWTCEVLEWFHNFITPVVRVTMQ